PQASDNATERSVPHTARRRLSALSLHDALPISRLGGRQSGAGELPRRRPADGDRLQPHARENPAEILSPGIRPRRRRAPRRRGRAREIRGPCRRDPPRHGRHRRSGAGRRGLRGNRGRQHGRGHQENFGAARPRCHRVHAVLLRRRGGAARLPGRRRARHDARLHPSARRRSFGLRHGARRYDGDARGGRRGEARGGQARCPRRRAGESVPVGARGADDPGRGAEPADWVRLHTGGRAHRAPVFVRERLAVADRIPGPAIIAEKNATTVVEPGWQAEVMRSNHIVLERVEARPQRRAIGTGVDPVMLEVFNNLYMSIAEQMGLRLANTAYSVNIKERLDFSCAVFDRQGSLIANAPHMPVHLGSMGESVRAVIGANRGRMKAGNVYVLNAPYNGGTHLPDVTVITPVFDDAGGEILFYVGSRGHHADIGGITPGSMPPGSRVVEEEGVLIDNFLLVEEGRLREAETVALLSSGRYPARNVQQNMADLRAMIAANEKGSQELRRMVAHFGLDVVYAYMRHVQDNVEEAVRRVIGVLKDGDFSYAMDNGGVHRAKITIRRDTRGATVVSAGTSIQLAGK